MPFQNQLRYLLRYRSRYLLLFYLSNNSWGINILQQQYLNRLERKVQVRYNHSDLLHCFYQQLKILRQGVDTKSLLKLSVAQRCEQRVYCFVWCCWRGINLLVFNFRSRLSYLATIWPIFIITLGKQDESKLSVGQNWKPLNNKSGMVENHDNSSLSFQAWCHQT